jgi:signal recognition particle subunit SRP54
MAFEGLTEKLNIVFSKLKSRGKLSETDINLAVREVKLALLEADVNFKVVKEFIKSISEKSIGEEVLKSLTPGQQVIKIVNEEMIELLGKNASKLNLASKPPTVLMVFGLQGAGKTTFCGKLAKMQKKQGKKVMLVACDTHRPAAAKQLEILAEKTKTDYYFENKVKPIDIAKKAIKQAKSSITDVVIIDTAGRLHIDDEMMDELIELEKIVKPDDKLLVVDAMTGQDAVNIAKTFDEMINITGVVLTKMDGDSRGGAALSVRAVTGKPIMFAGIGEKLDDLEIFHPERIASRILGMGDMLTLIEKAEQTIDEEKAKELGKKLQQASFTLDDFLDQMGQIKNMGPIGDILSMVPGGNKISADDIDEKQMDKTEAIIKSMTKEERTNPIIINGSRRKRIANGSGTNVNDVNRLLNQFSAMKKMMKQFSGKKVQMGKMPGMPF